MNTGDVFPHASKKIVSVVDKFSTLLSYDTPMQGEIAIALSRRQYARRRVTIPVMIWYHTSYSRIGPGDPRGDPWCLPGHQESANVGYHNSASSTGVIPLAQPADEGLPGPLSVGCVNEVGTTLGVLCWAARNYVIGVVSLGEGLSIEGGQKLSCQ